MAQNGPPTPVVSDYVELGYLSLFFLIGAPLNSVAFVLLGSPKNHLSDRLFYLKRHLNYSDLCVVLIFTPTRIFWLATYDWRIGSMACKMIKFLHAFSFQISSNIILCIALDRLFSVLRPNIPTRRNKRVTVMIVIAWISAGILCAPQLIVWNTIEVFPSWEQCSPVWEIARYKERNISSVSQLERLYGVCHVVFVFWFPMAMITFCYFVINCWLHRNSNIKEVVEVTKRVPEILVQDVEGHAGIKLTATDDYLATPSASPSSKTRGRYRSLQSPPLTPVSTPVFKKGGSGSSISQLNSLSPCSTPGNKKRSLAGSQSLPSGQIQEVKKPGSKRSSGVSSKSMSMMEDSCIYLKDVSKVKRKTFRLSCLLVCAYIVCWLPYGVLSIWKIVHTESYEVYIEHLYWLHGLVVFNSVINPFLYCMFGKVLRNR